MKIVKTIALAVFSIFAVSIIVPETSNAAPQNSTVHVKQIQKKKVVKKKVVKKKVAKKKQTSVVTANVDQRAQCFAGASDSHAAYFACDRLDFVAKAFASSRKSQQASYSANGKTHIISEASKLKGMHAKRNRVDLANYMRAGNNDKPVDPVKIPWCAAFANAVLRRSGYEGTDSLMARSFLNYGEKITNPSNGDIVVLKRGRSQFTGHVGFFDGYEWYGSQLYVKVVGGNQSKSVNVAHFPVDRVLGYRRPV